MKKLILLIFFYININILTQSAPSICNINSECPFGFVCLAGNANAVDDKTQITTVGALYYGYCAPTVPVRQICYLYAIMTGKLGKAIVALVVISMGFAFVTGKIEMKQFISLFTGVILLFGSFQIVNLLTNTNTRFCDALDLTLPLGVPANNFTPVPGTI